MSNKVPFIVLRFVGFLVFAALLIGGGAMVYNAGIAQGVSQAPVVATAISQAAENGQTAPVPPMMYGYGYGHPMYYGMHHFGFFPFAPICGSLIFLFFLFGLMKMIFFRGMWHRNHHHHGHWGKHWEGGFPPMFNEWHKRAHGEGGEKKEDEESAK